MVVLVALALEGGPRRWRQAHASRPAMRRVVVGLPRASLGAAAVALIEAEEQLGAGSGAPGAGAAAGGEFDAPPRQSD